MLAGSIDTCWHLSHILIITPYPSSLVSSAAQAATDPAAVVPLQTRPSSAELFSGLLLARLSSIRLVSCPDRFFQCFWVGKKGPLLSFSPPKTQEKAVWARDYHQASSMSIVFPTPSKLADVSTDVPLFVISPSCSCLLTWRRMTSWPLAVQALSPLRYPLPTQCLAIRFFSIVSQLVGAEDSSPGVA